MLNFWRVHPLLNVCKKGLLNLQQFPKHSTRVVDLALNQAAKPWFHQYLDLSWYHLWQIVSEDVFRGQICNLVHNQNLT